jgi:hypothetical protein
MTFNRSNTDWGYSTSRDKYFVLDSKIGSDNTVGSVSKLNFTFNNQTNKDYLFFLDISSSIGNIDFLFEYNDNNVFYYFSSVRFSTESIKQIILPSYYQLDLQLASSSAARYFDAWYLDDLGISEAYQQGLDAETDGILTDYLGTDAQQIGWVLIGIAAILFAFKGGK